MQVNGKEILTQNIPVRVKVTGSSMLPLIRGGDYVVIRPVDVKKLKIGDILAYLYSKAGMVFCHRLVKKENSRLIIKGDTHICGLETIQVHNLLGKVIIVEHERKKIDLETGFQLNLAGKIAWLSLNFPVLLYIIAYAIEVLRNPVILWRSIKQNLAAGFSRIRSAD